MIINTLESMLTALSAADKNAFLAKSTESFAKFSESKFDAISQNIAPHLRSGYKLKHLDDLKRSDESVSLFKLTFTDDSDELIAMISEKYGKVTGLLLK